MRPRLPSAQICSGKAWPYDSFEILIGHAFELAGKKCGLAKITSPTHIFLLPFDCGTGD